MPDNKRNFEETVGPGGQVDAIASREREFCEELGCLINKYSMENESDTPDFVLAEYLTICLIAFNKATEQRSAWYVKKVDHGSLQTAGKGMP